MRLTAFLIVILLNLQWATAQSFTAEAPLPGIEVDGFYQVPITPMISVYLNPTFTDMRIYDRNNREVPFLFQKEIPKFYTQKFKEYQILEKKKVTGCCSNLVLHNPDRNPINNISLVIKNAEATKEATLMGSDDKQNWFALKEHFTFYPIDNKSATTETKVVEFPLSNYIYYVLQVDDYFSAPLNILKVGYYEVSEQKGNYLEVPSLKIVKADSIKQKQSTITLAFDTARLVDKFEISMTGLPYFLRRAHLYDVWERKTKKGQIEKYNNLLQEFELSSTHSSVLELPDWKVREFLVVIENKDNPPLEVGSIKAYQLNRYVTAWLKKDDQYTLKLGNERLQQPNYDIAFFADKIPDNPPILKAGEIVVFERKGADASKVFFTNKMIIWVAIIFVVALLAVMSLKMAKDVGKEGKK